MLVQDLLTVIAAQIPTTHRRSVLQFCDFGAVRGSKNDSVENDGLLKDKGRDIAFVEVCRHFCSTSYCFHTDLQLPYKNYENIVRFL